MHPVVFKLGQIYITGFGLSLALAFFLSLFFAYRATKDNIDITVESLFDMIFITAFGALIGARIAYIIFNPQEFNNGILAYFLIREKPGLSYIGAILGGSFMFWLKVKTSSIDLSSLTDDLTGTLAMVLFFGHLGALLDGISFGRETTYPWGIAILGEEKLRQPLPLFYLLFLSFFFWLLPKVRLIAKKRRWVSGSVFLIFAACYSAFASLMNLLQQEIKAIGSYPIDFLFNLMLFFFFSLALYFKNRHFSRDLKLALAFIKKKIENRGSL